MRNLILVIAPIKEEAVLGNEVIQKPEKILEKSFAAQLRSAEVSE